MRALACALALLVACAPPAPHTPVAPHAQRCASAQTYDGARCLPFDTARQSLERGAAALEAFHPDEALVHLETAQTEGPYRHADHVRLYEKMGVAYAYLDEEFRARSSFDRLLVLAPSHAISYTLSPKATFVFERAREALGRPAEVRVRWPRDATVSDPLPVEIEVASDPAQHFVWARLFHRKHGEKVYDYADVTLPPAGRYTSVMLPAAAPDATEGLWLEVHLVVHDKRGNEVLLWARADQPERIPLAYQPELAWYERWWVWTIAGTVIGAITAITVVAATRPESETLEGSFSAR